MLLTISDRTSSYVQFMVVLLLFVFVLVLTYITTRWIAGYQKGRVSGGNIEVLEVYKVSANTYIQIVHIGNKYLAIGTRSATALDRQRVLGSEGPEIYRQDLQWL